MEHYIERSKLRGRRKVDRGNTDAKLPGLRLRNRERGEKQKEQGRELERKGEMGGGGWREGSAVDGDCLELLPVRDTPTHPPLSAIASSHYSFMRER